MGVTAAVLLTGCFNPEYPSGIPCSGRDTCPPGLTCQAGICQSAGADADAAPPGADATPSLDGSAPPPPDAARAIDAAPACERDEDCGDGQACAPGGACVAASCDDGAQNRDETDVDCGGAECPPCGTGETCEAPSDCASDDCGEGVCQAPECGNSLVQADEECDEGPVSTETCDADCTFPVCGDSFPNAPFGETCDEGPEDTATCDRDCTAPECGDGLSNIPFGETCDEGAVNTPTCDADCTAPVCGDGLLNTAADEACDDGNQVNSDGCSAACQLEDNCQEFNLSGFECPSGATAFCADGPLDRFNPAQAQQACEVCYGVPCFDEGADCAGNGFGPNPAGEHQCGDGYFGYQDGCTGDAGRIWAICTSGTTYGRWAPPGATPAATERGDAQGVAGARTIGRR
ncbi:MAG: hypothetical protein Tsb0020_45460 [Haliangiales bacterium]